MIKYWPNKPGIELNDLVVQLFVNTNNKLQYNLNNKTSKYLYIDILDNLKKYRLLSIALKEIEILILDVTELNIDIKELNQIEYNLLKNLIDKIYSKFVINISNSNKKFKLESKDYLYLLINENFFIKSLIIYLVFGSSQIEPDLFIFNTNKTPREHVRIIFENFLIQISNFTIYQILDQYNSFDTIVNFLAINQICQHNYISPRSISLLVNNITWDNYLKQNIFQTLAIYNSKYTVILFSSKGLINKHIYALRLKTKIHLSKIKYIILLYIEIIDFLIPKIEKLIFNIGKYIIYFFMNLLRNSIVLFVRLIIRYI